MLNLLQVLLEGGLIFQEKVSGATIDKKELQKMLEDLKISDTVYVTDLTKGTVEDV